MKDLNVYFNRKKVGEFRSNQAQHLDFQYTDEWLKDPESFPLSLSMPLQVEPRLYPKPHIFLENLLPEEKVRRAVELANKLPKDSPYQFLKEFGADSSGAFSIGTEDPSPPDNDGIEEIPLDYIDQAIKEGRLLYQSIHQDLGAKFSLAGAQDKFCVTYKDARIWANKGGNPSTHIAKIDLNFKNSQTVYNEFFCMRLAKEVGLPVAEVSILSGKHPILLVKRFDRKENAGKIERIHQEDFCQALGVASSQKYEDHGGPNIKTNYNLIKTHSRKPIEDLEAFLNWIAFNLIIGNNDSHSKNLAFLYSARNLSLAPFYDLLSTAVYGTQFSQEFALSIGGKSHYRALRKEHIDAMEKSIGIRSNKFVKNFSSMHRKIAESIGPLRDSLARDLPKQTIMKRIQDTVENRLEHFLVASNLLR